MADSDEESTYRRDREKFIRERYGVDNRGKSDRYQGSSDRRFESGRDLDGSRSYPPPRREFNTDLRKRPSRDYDRDRRDVGSRESFSPPSKRFRSSTSSNTDDRRISNYPGFFNQNDSIEFSKLECDKFILRSFKEFISAQDDDVDEDSGLKRYKEYKSLFHKSKISSFFINHQAEEWMMMKYHPRYIKEFRLRKVRNIKKRLAVFLKCLEQQIFNKLVLSFANKNISQLLTAVSVMMEGDELPKKENRISATNIDSQSIPLSQGTIKEVDESEEHSTIYEDKEDLKCSPKDGNKIAESCIIDFSQLSDVIITKSLFIRNYPAFSKRKTLEREFKSLPGYLRLAISEPSARRKFSQRAWLSFKKDTDIKDACVSVNDLRNEEADLYVIVNQELPRKVRPVDSASACKAAVRYDFILACHLIRQLDEMMSTYRGWSIEEFGEKSLFRLSPGFTESEELNSQHIPFKENLEKEQHRLAEAVAETECYIFSSDEEIETVINSLPRSNSLWQLSVFRGLKQENFERDPITEDVLEKCDLCLCDDWKLLAALDLCIMYLRVVHSFDFYLLVTYTNEHDMPQRCGVINVRGTVADSQTECSMEKALAWINERKQKTFTITNPESLKISDEDAKILGLKDKEEEKKKFFDLNTVKLASDKWLCTLSGKKFRGSEYVEKHIKVKHADKIEKVLEEVEYFNNYLRDSAKPSVPLEVGNGDSTAFPHSTNFGSHSQNSSLNQNNFNKGNSSHRKIVSYSDKDTPSINSMDFF